MATSKKFTVKFRRKRKGKTNYKKRLQLLLSGKPRIVIRKSLKHIQIQMIEYQPEGDKILLTVNSKELTKKGWKNSTSNIPASYLTGMLFGKKAQEKGIKECILDLGFNVSNKGSRIYAALKGAIDAGLNIPHSTEILPRDDRVQGKHIAEYAKTNKKLPADITNHFEEIKKKI